MKIQFSQDWSSGSLRIYITEERGDKWFCAKPMKLEFDPVDTQDAFGPPPSLVIPPVTSRRFLDALAAALAERGMKLESEHKLEGLLESTKYHLEDMRRLVFVDSKPTIEERLENT